MGIGRDPKGKSRDRQPLLTNHAGISQRCASTFGPVVCNGTRGHSELRQKILLDYFRPFTARNRAAHCWILLQKMNDLTQGRLLIKDSRQARGPRGTNPRR